MLRRARRWSARARRSAATSAAVYGSNDYDSYRRLFEEGDAFEAGRKVEVQWRHHDTVNGHFEHSTHDAVVALQQHYSLHPDGVCGEQTWEMLGRVYFE